MSGGRPRTTIGTFGVIRLAAAPGGWMAATRVRVTMMAGCGG